MKKSTYTILILGILLIILASVVLAFIAPERFSQNQDGGEVVNQNTNNTNTPDNSMASELVTVAFPNPNQKVSGLLTVTGEARGQWFFEGSSTVEVVSRETGEVLLTEIVVALEDAYTTEYIPFVANVYLPYDLDQSEYAADLVFRNANPSGDPERDLEFHLPIVIESIPTEKRKEITLYYIPSIQDDADYDCGAVVPITRTIRSVQGVGRVTLDYLLATPPLSEQNDYFTSFSPDTHVRSLSIEDGVAYVDFDQLPSGGSCKILAARAQIETTLKQFPSVDDVVISVMGDVEGALQP